MGFVDDNGVIPAQVGITLGFRQQDAVGHHLDIGIRGRAVSETNFVTNGPAGFLPQFFGNAAGYRDGGDSPRLGAADQAIDPPAGRQAKLGKLGGFAGTGFTGDNDDRMLCNGSDDLVFFGKDRQRFIEVQRRDIFPAAVSFLHGCLQAVFQPFYPGRQLSIRFGFAGFARQVCELAPGCLPVDNHNLRQIGFNFFYYF